MFACWTYSHKLAPSKFTGHNSCDTVVEIKIFEIVTWPKFHVALRIGAYHCKSAPCLVWWSCVFCSMRYNVFNLSRDLTWLPHWEDMQIFRVGTPCVTCNFQSMKISVELNSFSLKFFCYITWINETRDWRPCKRGLYVKSYCLFETTAWRFKNYTLQTESIRKCILNEYTIMEHCKNCLYLSSRQ